MKANALHIRRKPIKAFTFERKDPEKKKEYIQQKGIGTGHISISSGHEIVGKVTAGSAVSKFKVGEIAGVGCFVDSCRTCKSCAGDEQLVMKE
jgi:uncharacterized zinc-type alcohol dehydrogenase-like protein